MVPSNGIPQDKQEFGTYTASLKKAHSDFLSGDFAQMAQNAGASYVAEKNVIETVFIGLPYSVSCEDALVWPIGHEAELSPIDQSVVLHNLLVASGRKLSGELVTFRQFRKVGRAGGPAGKEEGDEFARIYTGQPALLDKLLEVYPGKRSNHGDASIEILALPRLPLTIVLWEGEDNIIPPSCNILMDSTAGDYLPLEDLSAIGPFALEKFVELANNGFKIKNKR